MVEVEAVTGVGRVPYPSIEAMVEPTELGQMLGWRVDTVALVPVDGAQTSTDARFMAVTVDGEASSGLFIKLVDPAGDWVALVTEDHARRAVATWTHDVLARMPRAVDPAVIACASWEDGYAILMPDITADLAIPGARLTPTRSAAIIDAMAAMHAAFWEDARLADDALGLCAPEHFLSHTSPRKASRLRDQLTSFVFDAIEAGWDALPSFVDPGLVRELRALDDDPSTIVEALGSSPRTLVHSDIRPANLGLRDQVDGGVQVFLIDWGRPMFTAPAVDLGYYLGWTAVERATGVDDTIAAYETRLRARLGPRLDDSWWPRQREIGILGGLLNTICFRALAARGEDATAATERAALAGWTDRMRRAVRMLG